MTGPSGRNKLTGREVAVLSLAAQGLTQQQTAYELGTGLETVNSQRDSGRRKLHAKNNVHAVAIAIREGLI